MSITIRPIQHNDKPRWQEMMHDYLTFYETSRPNEVLDVVFERLFIDDLNEFSGIVADMDDKLIGFCHYLPHRKMWDIQRTMYLQDLFVAPLFRQQGAARAMIMHVHAAASRLDCNGVYWLTQMGNNRARALYDNIAQPTDFIKYAMNIASV